MIFGLFCQKDAVYLFHEFLRSLRISSAGLWVKVIWFLGIPLTDSKLSGKEQNSENPAHSTEVFVAVQSCSSFFPGGRFLLKRKHFSIITLNLDYDVFNIKSRGFGLGFRRKEFFAG